MNLAGAVRRRSARASVGVGLLGLAPATFLGVFVVWPLVAILARNLADVGWRQAFDVVTSDATRSILTFTVGQALASTALTLVLGGLVAHTLASWRFPGRAVLRAFSVVPFVLPTVVVAAAFDSVLPTGLGAVLAAHVFFNLAVVVRVVGGFWATLDRRPLEAARVLGASPWQAFRTVTLPRLAPAVASAGVVVFLFCFTSFGVILILGGPTRATLETEIYRRAVFRGEFDIAAVLAVVQVVAVVVLAARSSWLQRRAAVPDRGAATPPRVRGASARLQVAGAVAVVAVVQGVPVASLIARSLRTGDGWGLANYRRLTEPVQLLPVTTAEALVTSLRFAVAAAVIAAVLGGLAALAITTGGRLGRGLEALALVPLGVSAVTLGFGYLVAFAAFDLRRSLWLVPCAHAVVGFPFVLASLVPARRAIDPRLRAAAATLGASPITVARTVDWPLLRRPLATGAGFAAAISIGEFGATSFLARGASGFTAPLAIFRLLSQPGDLLRGQAMALSVVVGLVVGALALVLEHSRSASGVAGSAL